MRGSSLVFLFIFHLHLVSPACAGIVPRLSCGPSRRPCFPRVCGDRPTNWCEAIFDGAFPPRVRGSSPRRDPRRDRHHVSPACAGIVPASRRRSADLLCFPRVCGDRPLALMYECEAREFPPRVRGSSPHVTHFLLDIRVSPACAGIVPFTYQKCNFTFCFPRVCGDRPMPLRAKRSKTLFPPRVRGSSRCMEMGRARARVSPACAGIVPSMTIMRTILKGFPRVCGDRPFGRSSSTAGGVFPPRVRGSSPSKGRSSRTCCVSPACAGIVPKHIHGSPCASRFPRVCGDRPWRSGSSSSRVMFPPRVRGSSPSHADALLPRQVSPACAGIVPLSHGHEAGRWCFPRVCGDRPTPHCGTIRSPTFPPRVRGSSPLQLFAPHPLHVSPACAGIVPYSSPTIATYLSFPRVCGDRPSLSNDAYTNFSFPPRVRGSSPFCRE